MDTCKYDKLQYIILKVCNDVGFACALDRNPGKGTYIHSHKCLILTLVTTLYSDYEANPISRSRCITDVNGPLKLAFSMNDA